MNHVNNNYWVLMCDYSFIIIIHGGNQLLYGRELQVIKHLQIQDTH